MALAVLEKNSTARSGSCRTPPTEALVDEGAALDARMKRDALRMAEIKTFLVEHGPGEYFGTKGGRALVIFPAPRIAPKAEIIPEMEKAIGKPAFNMLFERTVVYKAVKSCRDVASRILAGAKLKRFFELAETDSPAQVRFG
jgi:hypothetical protein